MPDEDKHVAIKNKMFLVFFFLLYRQTNDQQAFNTTNFT